MIGEIVDLSHDGRGIVKENGVYFLDGGLIGDKVEYVVTNEKKKQGRITKIIEKSKYRIESPCLYSDECGGCPLIELDYKKELEWKKSRVENAIRRIGKIDKKVEPIVENKNPFRYRNIVQLKVQDGKIGYFKKGTHEVLDIDDCKIAPEEIKDVIKILKNWNGLSSIEQAIIRVNYQGEMMVILGTRTGVKKENNLLEKLLDLKVISVYEDINRTRNHYGYELREIYKSKQMYEKIGKHKFIVEPGTFLQVNPYQVENLYNLAVKGLELEKTDRVMDLYSGIGTISLKMAEQVESVVAVESFEGSVEIARKNAGLNGIENVEFAHGKVEELTEELEKYTVNKVLLDPPRAGAKEEALKTIIKLNPERIAYVSCNPSTLARDLQILGEKYKIEKIIPVDMFSHSSHVECIALIQRVKS
ncbi:23S rRNA (uracil(1939)-C(5))-methyltransferase RlmD [Peptoniphilus sp.]|uniref:23S rRNA (uracil(1939)-C(5))-methyltransferase RlmD n=1 Tax=Peptoniphilus sp. TaxID=1971214 RepID=UPI0039962CF4